MHEKVLEDQNMVASLRYYSFLPGRKIGPKNCAILKNCARCWGTYLKSLVITKKYRLRPNLYRRFIKGYLRPGKKKIQGSKPFSVNNFSHFSYPKPGFAQLLGFTKFIGCGKNNPKLGYSGVVTRKVRKGLRF